MSTTTLSQTNRGLKTLPLVCAYVITYDGKRFLERCFRTLEQLTDYGNYHLILADNGSTDRSGDYVRENFPEVEVLRIFPNAGYAHGANEAVRHAKSQGAKYVVLMNDDIEILHEQWLSAAIAHAERDPSIGIIGFHEPESNDPMHATPEPTLTDVVFFSGFAMVISLEVFDRIGLFDEVYFVVGDDDDLTARALAAGYRVVVLDIPIYHLGGGTTQHDSLRTAYLQMRNGIRFCLKNRNPLRALIRAARIVDIACNPWPLSFDQSDAAHRKMRNTGNVLANASIWVQAVVWNVFKIPQTLRIRIAERRLIDATLASRKVQETSN